ncbi:hypothetical protein [Acidovorax sp.]|uniref:hypothetical protein n=1 Tax=Acidovorax sp. TaxID=1872122 RepID=UPI0025BAC8C4|nr:hypothetical protein [Acidovorax sp.]
MNILSNQSIGARMATALGLVLALLLGAALFGIAALYRSLNTEERVYDLFRAAQVPCRDGMQGAGCSQ